MTTGEGTPEQSSPGLGDVTRSRRSRHYQEARPASEVPKGTRPGETVGGALERRVARLEFAEGAFIRLRVPVPANDAEPGRDVLTDVDVLSLDIDLRLRVSRSSIECKSGAGQQGEPNTLIWLAGFKQLMNFDRSVLVRQTVSSRGRALARRLEIGVLDVAALSDRERAHRWLPEHFAHLDGPACIKAEARTAAQLKGLPDLPASVVQLLRGHAPLMPPHSLLTAVATYGAGARRQGVVPDPAATILAGHCLIAILLAAIQDAGQLDYAPPGLLGERLSRALTVGDPDNTGLLAVLERADALVQHMQDRTHRAYVNVGAQAQDIRVPSLREAIAQPPTYLDDYIDLVQRLRANPQTSRDLPQTAELLCFDGLLGDVAWRSPAFAHLFTMEHRGLLLVAIRCLGAVAGEQVARHLYGIASERFFDFEGQVPDRRVAPRVQEHDEPQTRRRSGPAEEMMAEPSPASQPNRNLTVLSRPSSTDDGREQGEPGAQSGVPAPGDEVASDTPPEPEERSAPMTSLPAEDSKAAPDEDPLQAVVGGGASPRPQQDPLLGVQPVQHGSWSQSERRIEDVRTYDQDE